MKHQCSICMRKYDSLEEVTQHLVSKHFATQPQKIDDYVIIPDTLEPLESVSRVVVVRDGVEFEGYNLTNVRMSVQDNGRTLKIFTDRKEESKNGPKGSD